MHHRSDLADRLSEAGTAVATADIVATETMETVEVPAMEAADAVRVIYAVICGARIHAASAWVEIFAPAAD